MPVSSSGPSLLSVLEGEDLRQFLRFCTEESYAAGAAILEEGQRPAGLYVIEAGRVVVLKMRGRRRERLATLRQGQHFGEMGLVGGDRTAARVEAVTETRLLLLSVERFQRLIDEYPTLATKVLLGLSGTLARRLRRANRHLLRLRRRRNLRAVAAHLLAVSWLYTRIVGNYAWVWLRWRLGRPLDPAALEKLNRASARRFKEVACRLKGANVKLAQLASLQAHILPPEVIDELRTLRDQVTPTEYDEIAGVIESEFGASPLELFDRFDKMPLASASMGQVHEAQLPSGERVVVKVLHPGLERSVAIDVKVMELVMRLVGRLVPKIDLLQLHRELEKPLYDELNLIKEAKATTHLGRDLVRFGVRAPRVHWRYSSRRVLTLEFIDGVTLADVETLRSWGIDRKRLIRTYLEAFLRQAFEGGFFHCDPHPGNALVTPEGQLVMIDFGMVKRMPDIVRIGLMKELMGGFFNNVKLYADGIIDRGIIDESERAVLETFAEEVFSDPRMRRAIFDHDLEGPGEMKVLSGKMYDLLGRLETFRTPQDQLMFLRALGIVIDVCREVYPEEPVSEVARPVATGIFRRFLRDHPEYARLPLGEGPEGLARLVEGVGLLFAGMAERRSRLERDVRGFFLALADRLPGGADRRRDR